MSLPTSSGMADLTSASVSNSNIPPAPIADLVPVPAETPDVADTPGDDDDDFDHDPITKCQIPANFLPRWGPADLLDLALGNYRVWERRIVHVLSVCGELALYLDPAYARPARTTKARAADARAWIYNERLVQGFIRSQCSDAEADHLPDVTTAGDLWVLLRDRHLNRGPHAQVLLLRDLLRLRFDTSKPLAPQAHSSKVGRIHGPPHHVS